MFSDKIKIWQAPWLLIVKGNDIFERRSSFSLPSHQSTLPLLTARSSAHAPKDLLLSFFAHPSLLGIPKMLDLHSW
jgi:hypothetical protein